MENQIKMIGLDCDGTLLNNQKELTAYSREVLTRALERGIIVLAATGRPLTGVPKEVMALPGIRYVLTSNGARIVDVQENRIMHEQVMELQTAEQVLAVFRKYDTYKEVFIEGTGYSDEEELQRVHEYTELDSIAKYMRECRVPVKSVEELLKEKRRSVDKVHALFRNAEDRRKAFREIAEIGGVTLTASMACNIEVNAAGVNKGSALLRLGELLGIRREEIMACGDGMNDLEMVRQAGLGVAVENAVSEVKAAADYITDSNENDGVAKAIEKFAFE